MSSGTSQDRFSQVRCRRNELMHVQGPQLDPSSCVEIREINEHGDGQKQGDTDDNQHEQEHEDYEMVEGSECDESEIDQVLHKMETELNEIESTLADYEGEDGAGTNSPCEGKDEDDKGVYLVVPSLLQQHFSARHVQRARQQQQQQHQ